jgi:hypothetical protein
MVEMEGLRIEVGLPVILRFLMIVGVLAGCVYGGMLALVSFHEPEPHEITVVVPTSKMAK